MKDYSIPIIKGLIRRSIREEIRQFFEENLLEKPNGEVVVNKGKYVNWNRKFLNKPSKIE